MVPRHPGCTSKGFTTSAAEQTEQDGRGEARFQTIICPQRMQPKAGGKAWRGKQYQSHPCSFFPVSPSCKGGGVMEGNEDCRVDTLLFLFFRNVTNERRRELLQFVFNRGSLAQTLGGYIQPNASSDSPGCLCCPGSNSQFLRDPFKN